MPRCGQGAFHPPKGTVQGAFLGAFSGTEEGAISSASEVHLGGVCIPPYPYVGFALLPMVGLAAVGQGRPIAGGLCHARLLKERSLGRRVSHELSVTCRWLVRVRLTSAPARTPRPNAIVSNCLPASSAGGWETRLSSSEARTLHGIGEVAVEHPILPECGGPPFRHSQRANRPWPGFPTNLPTPIGMSWARRGHAAPHPSPAMEITHAEA